MKSMTLALAIGAASVVASAQQTPDFTGRWVLTKPEKAPPALAQVLEVTQSDAVKRPELPALVVTLLGDGQIRSRRHEIGLVGGRTIGVDRDGRKRGPDTTYSVRWDGDSLVIAEGKSAWDGQPEQTHVEIWSLDSAGTLTITMKDNGQESTATYRRQAAKGITTAQLQVDFGAGLQPKRVPTHRPDLGPMLPALPTTPVGPPADCQMARRADTTIDRFIAQAPPSDVKFTMRVIEVPPCLSK
jgi:hypothetical protein